MEFLKKNWLTFVVIAVIAVVAWYVWKNINEEKAADTAVKGDAILPQAEELVSVENGNGALTFATKTKGF